MAIDFNEMLNKAKDLVKSKQGGYSNISPEQYLKEMDKATKSAGKASGVKGIAGKVGGVATGATLLSIEMIQTYNEHGIEGVRASIPYWVSTYGGAAVGAAIGSKLGLGGTVGGGVIGAVITPMLTQQVPVSERKEFQQGLEYGQSNPEMVLSGSQQAEQSIAKQRTQELLNKSNTQPANQATTQAQQNENTNFLNMLQAQQAMQQQPTQSAQPTQQATQQQGSNIGQYQQMLQQAAAMQSAAGGANDYRYSGGYINPQGYNVDMTKYQQALQQDTRRGEARRLLGREGQGYSAADAMSNEALKAYQMQIANQAGVPYQDYAQGITARQAASQAAAQGYAGTVQDLVKADAQNVADFNKMTAQEQLQYRQAMDKQNAANQNALMDRYLQNQNALNVADVQGQYGLDKQSIITNDPYAQANKILSPMQYQMLNNPQMLNAVLNSMPQISQKIFPSGVPNVSGSTQGQQYRANQGGLGDILIKKQEESNE